MNNNRRSFLKTLAISVGALAAAPLLRIQSAFAEMVKESDVMVKALGYVAKAKDSKFRKDKKAFCNNCNFYLADEKAPSAKCQLITSGEVSGEGWCKSWSKKEKKKA